METRYDSKRGVFGAEIPFWQWQGRQASRQRAAASMNGWKDDQIVCSFRGDKPPALIQCRSKPFRWQSPPFNLPSTERFTIRCSSLIPDTSDPEFQARIWGRSPQCVWVDYTDLNQIVWFDQLGNCHLRCRGACVEQPAPQAFHPPILTISGSLSGLIFLIFGSISRAMLHRFKAIDSVDSVRFSKHF